EGAIRACARIAKGPSPQPSPRERRGCSGKMFSRFTGLGLAVNNVKSSCADLFRVSTSLFQLLQGVDGRHKAGQDEIGGAMFLPSSLRDFPRTALRGRGEEGPAKREGEGQRTHGAGL